MRRLALSLGFVMAFAAMGVAGVSLYLADRLADFGLPGLAALLAIGANVAFMLAARASSRSH